MKKWTWLGRSMPVVLVAVAMLAPPVQAQVGEALPEQERDVEVRPGDVESLDAIVAALYDVISGPTGQARDWDRMRSLFLPTARLIPVQRNAAGEVAYRAITVDEYVEGAGPGIEAMGFREHEVARRVDAFGDVAHVFSTYEGFREGDEEPFLSGLNSIQLIFDGSRWWIASLAWSPTRPDLPIPPEYSPNGGIDESRLLR